MKTNRLQDSHDKEYINGDKYFQQVPSTPGHGEQAMSTVGKVPPLREFPPCLLDSQALETVVTVSEPEARVPVQAVPRRTSVLHSSHPRPERSGTCKACGNVILLALGVGHLGSSPGPDSG